MHLITQSFLLFIWLNTLNVVNADCTLEEFLNGPLYDSHFDTSGLRQSYPPGKQVRVSCQTGYVGFFKLRCLINVGWTNVGAKCEPKSCGHPGDADFADYSLVKGDDFVFGAEVQYTCQIGYQMVSRITSRRCDVHGWDGVVPVCQPIHCPVIEAADNVQIFGDREEATYGSVLRFSCKSRDLILDGEVEIECDEKGLWSKPAPSCTEVKCPPPQIDNGRVLDNIAEYKKDQTLRFECNAKYTRSHTIPSKCTRVGNRADWTPTPLCDPVRCELPMTTMTGTSYEHADGRRIFTPDDTVTVICGSNYFIGIPSETTKVITCLQSGEWETSPVCEEVTCNNPRYETGVYSTNDWHGRRRKLGNTITYSCSSGYRATHATKTATCTRAGWEPKPLCKEIKCEKPDIPNAEINNPKMEYRSEERLRYRCLSAHGWSETTCKGNGWTPAPVCETDRKPCKPEVENGFGYSSDDNTKLFYTCNSAYKRFHKGWWGSATCSDDGTWKETPRCIAVGRCGEIPQISHANITTPVDDDYRAGQSIPVVCDKGYRLNSNISQLTCTDGEWKKEYPVCERIAGIESNCGPPPKVQDAVAMCDYQKEYKSGMEVHYKCRHQYKMEGEDKIQCKNGEWEEKNLRCLPKSCPRPPPVADSDINIEGLPDNNGPMPPGHNLTFSCRTRGRKLSGMSMSRTVLSVTCGENEEWNPQPFPSSCEDVTCLGPTASDQIVISNLPENLPENPIQFGHTIKIECSNPRKQLNGSSELTCGDNGEWDPAFPSCEVTCKVPTLNRHVRITNQPQQSPGKGDTLQFQCSGSRYLQGEKQIECLEDGNWSHDFPICTESVNSCGTPPVLEDGDLRDVLKPQYSHGEKVHYVCQRVYIISGESRTCQNGRWVGNVKCLKPCTVNEDNLNQNNMVFLRGGQDKLHCPHNDHITFRCKKDHTPDIHLRQKCTDGVITLPFCSPNK